MSIFDKLSDEQTWNRFLTYKALCGNLSPDEELDLVSYVANKEYLPVVEKVRHCTFPDPAKIMVGKMGSEKKRVVYCFPREENYLLKLMTFLLLREYEHEFAPNLFSFRVKHGVNKAVRRLKSNDVLPQMHTYKVDIHNYFNSIDIDLLFPKLDRILHDDPTILNFIKSLLTNPSVVLRDGSVIQEKKGIMAGIPISSFLANIFLSDMDWHFHENNTLYLRYSDDIIILQPNSSKLTSDVNWLKNHISSLNLEINPEKEQWTAPGDEWTFLGLKYHAGVFDISDISVKKICDKMRRKHRALIRWRHRKGVPPEKAAQKFVAIFNRKLYENRLNSDLTWTRWFFPIINTTTGLRCIDHYLQQCVRFIMTESHTNKIYRCSYAQNRSLGYRCLVNEYYKFKTRSADGGTSTPGNLTPTNPVTEIRHQHP